MVMKHSNNDERTALIIPTPRRAMVSTTPNSQAWMNDEDRKASPWRKQLLMLLCDKSGSMSYGGKNLDLTTGVIDTIIMCKMKSLEGDPIFDLGLWAYNDRVTHLGRKPIQPVNEYNEDDIDFSDCNHGTAIKHVLEETHKQISAYDRTELSTNTEPQRVPPPMVILATDGHNGDGDPRPIAEKIKSMKLSIGVSPFIVTLGVGYAGGEPDVSLLQDIASETEKGETLYFDIQDAHQLSRLVATLSSSAAATPTEAYRVAMGQGRGIVD